MFFLIGQICRMILFISLIILIIREHTAEVILEQLDTATDPWGIKVERVEVKDVRLPQQLQRSMAAEAEAAREARPAKLADFVSGANQMHFLV